MAVKDKKKGKDKRKQPDVAAKLNALPNTFKFAAETLKTMSERGGSAGSIVVGKYKSYNYKLIFALVMNTIKNIKLIKKIIHEIKLAQKVPVDDPFLLEILLGDLLFGRGLKSVEQNSSAASIIAQKDVIVKQQNLLKKTHSAESADSTAKYLRINLLKTNLDHVLSQIKTVGLQQVEYSKDKIKFKKFINKFKSMDENEFMLDFHFPNDLIVVKGKGADKLKKTDLIKKGKVMLQDKASFMAVEAMDVKPTNHIIDACCAPGCKTSLIAGKMKNKGKILAFDIDKKRLVSALHLLKVQGVNCVITQVKDFSKVKLNRLPKAHNTKTQFDSIIIDPSCSGSGIKSRIDYKPTSTEAGRLKKLQAFQVSLLKHALRARVSKRIVYCTCSTSVEENEQVVEMALRESGVDKSWNIVEILPYWSHRGDSSFEFGSKCVRSDENNLTNGFFIAALELDPLVEIKNDDSDDAEQAMESADEEEDGEDDEVEDEDDEAENEDEGGNDDEDSEEEMSDE